MNEATATDEREAALASIEAEEAERREALVTERVESQRRLAAEKAKREAEAERIREAEETYLSERAARLAAGADIKEALQTLVFACARSRGAAMRMEDAAHRAERGGGRSHPTPRFAQVELRVVLHALAGLGPDVRSALPVTTDDADVTLDGKSF